MPSRTANTLKNAQIGALCFVASILVSFFSRKVFLDNLGTDFLGFTGTIGSIIGFLNISELGIGSAVSIVLYRPLFEKDQYKIAEILAVLANLYRKVGAFILIAGALISCLFPLIFADIPFSNVLLYLGFYSYLISALLGYFINYGSVLLSADQQNYVVTGYYQIFRSLKVIAQCFLAVYFCNLYLFFIIEIIFSLINSAFLVRRINKQYRYINNPTFSKQTKISVYPEIQKKIWQTFAHKIGGYVQDQAAPLFIYGFVSLPMVALYGNYMLISGSLRTLIYNVLMSSIASVGNLVAEGNKQKIYGLYAELLSMRFVCAGILAGSMYFLLPTLISIWLGEHYVLSSTIAALVSFHLFLCIIREVTDQFLTAYGLVQDVLSPLAEAIVYFCFSILGGYFYGLQGILTGSIGSILLVIYTWKPYFLYKKGFQLPLRNYLSLFFRQFFLLIILFGIFYFIIVSFLYPNLDSFIDSSLLEQILHIIIVPLLLAVVMILGYGLFSPEFRQFLTRIRHLLWQKSV